MSSFRQRLTSNSSLWNLPGLEKDTFYAAALYLHAAKGEFEGKPLYREPKTPEATRDFLDGLANFFARSKLQDARDHVSAAAMTSLKTAGDSPALINKCKFYQNAKSNLTDPTNQASGLLATYAQLAGQVRQHRKFRDLTDEVETAPSDKGIKLRDLAQTVKWINYLGRVYAAYASFIKFCADESQREYSFEYRLLESQDDDWFGDTYLQKIQSWTGELDLTDELKLHKTADGMKVTEYRTVEALMAGVVKAAGNKARVHCEMQLLMHFSQPGVENCLDYFGCSKKSCWLCWQMILQNSKYSMKNTHQPAIAEGLRVAYVEMLSLIQNKVVRGIPIRSLEPYLQTLAPMTRRMSIVKDPGQDIEAGLFSFNPIAAPDSFHCVSLPALHLPVGENPGKIRQVQVYGYEHHIPSKMQYPPFAILNGKKHLLAFQLLTLPKGLEKQPQGTEYRCCFWADRNFSPISRGSGMIYKLYYRLADILAPNPRVLSLWRRAHGEDPEFFPWRGDVFILYLPNILENVAPQSSQIDESDCLESLEALFKRMGPDYAKWT